MYGVLCQRESISNRNNINVQKSRQQSHVENYFWDVHLICSGYMYLLGYIVLWCFLSGLWFSLRTIMRNNVWFVPYCKLLYSFLSYPLLFYWYHNTSFRGWTSITLSSYAIYYVCPYEYHSYICKENEKRISRYTAVTNCFTKYELIIQCRVLDSTL